MSRIGYIFSHPIEASRTFWRALIGRETLDDRINDEEAKMRALRTAIGLYHLKYGRLPAALRDLCDNNYGDPDWDGPFIRWSGEDTFWDTFGYPYKYTVSDGRSELISPGLETAKRCAAEQSGSA
jgi:hypothetical protein